MRLALYISSILISGTLATPAYATDAWVCSFPSFDKEHTPIMMKLKIQGEMLKDVDSDSIGYRILQNDELMLTAAQSELFLGFAVVHTIVIEKKTKNFGFSSTTPTEVMFTKGKCIKD